MVTGVVTSDDARCPGALHLVPVRDGLLARIRVPGGLIAPAQLRALAEAAQRCGDGRLDLTSRANVQIRGVGTASVEVLHDALVIAGLLPSAEHDRVRNIATSPSAGADPTEIVDPRPFVRQLDARLVADAALAALPAKFAFAIDGGGRRFELAGSDLALCAVRVGNAVRFHLLVAGVASGFGTAPESAVALLIEAARAALAFANAGNAATHRWRVASLCGAPAAILAALGDLVTACAEPAQRVAETAPLGVFAADRDDLVNVVPSIPLGRLDARQAFIVADAAERCGADLRLAPWRGFVLAALPREALATVRAELARAGLPLDTADGYAGLAACTGVAGCASALADVRGEAAVLAGRLRGLTAPAGWSVNFAGCEKRCAMRRGASVELIATEHGYEVKVIGRTVRSAASSGEALALAFAAHGIQLAERDPA